MGAPPGSWLTYLGGLMDERIWHRWYGEDLPRDIQYPQIPLHEILDVSAGRFPERAAISFLGKNITYRQLHREVLAFARGLAGLGIGKGERVALFLPNVPQMVVAYYGTLKAGAVGVLTNPLYTERELLYQVKDSGAKALVTLDLVLTLSKVKAGEKALGLERVIVGRVSDYLPFPKNILYPLLKRKDLEPVPENGKYIGFSELLGGTWPSLPEVRVAPDDIGVLMYTGGTTGLSKGAMLTHENLVANAYQAFGWVSSGKMECSPDEAIMTILPLFHSFAMTGCMNHGILRGARLILFPSRPRKDLSDLLKMVRRERPTMLPGVPALYTALVNNPKAAGYGLGSIKVCNSGAAPLPVEILKGFESMTGAKMLEGYGLSEASPVAVCNPLEGRRKAGSIGTPMQGTDVRIVDQEKGETDVRPGDPGELLLRGPQVMKGYWNRPEETAEALRDGWLWTGDIARMDEDGYIYIVDRKKDMIIVAGFKVFPREVEEVLYEHPKVLDAAVVGVRDERCGEHVKAFVVLKDGEEATADEMVAFCKGKLTGYKIPREVVFRKELPKSNVGKVIRRLLRESSTI